MKYSYFPTGVCSRQINLELDDNGKITSLLKVWTQKTLLTN